MLAPNWLLVAFGAREKTTTLAEERKDDGDSGDCIASRRGDHFCVSQFGFGARLSRRVRLVLRLSLRVSSFSLALIAFGIEADETTTNPSQKRPDLFSFFFFMLLSLLPTGKFHETRPTKNTPTNTTGSSKPKAKSERKMANRDSGQSGDTREPLVSLWPAEPNRA